MEDNSSYTYTYEKNENENKPERSLKIIFAGVIAALAVFSIVLGIFFGVKKTPDPETTTTTEPSTSEENTTQPVPKSPYAPGLYKVNTDGMALYFRKDHSKDADTILEIDNGTELNILEVYHDTAAVSEDYMYWGKTQFKGHTGWVAMKYMKKAYSDNVVTPEDASTTVAATEITGTTAKTEENTTGIILPPPTEPSTSAAEEQTATQVSTTSAEEAKFAAGDYVVSTGGSTLTFRKGPGTNNETILSINDGEKISVLEVVDTGDSNGATRFWGKVTYQGHTGYVCMAYLEKVS